jgi:PAS domain S-box-containing protein
MTLWFLLYFGSKYRKLVDTVQTRDRELIDFVENAAVGMNWVGPDGTILWANQEELNVLGHNREDYVGHPIAEFFADREVIEDMLAKLNANVTLRGYEARLRHKDGSLRHVVISANAYFENGCFIHTRCFTRDITDRVRAEQTRSETEAFAAVNAQLRESEDRYRDLVEHSQDLICTHDLDGRILSVNPWAAKVLGYEQAELVNMNLRDVLVPSVRHEVDGYLAAIRTDGAAQGLMLMQPRAGEKRVWEYNNTLRTEGVSTPIVRGMAHDITERRRAERELERQAALSRLLESLAAAANKANTPEEALATCLERICAYGGWNIGHVLRIARDGDGWRASGTQWHFTDSRARERFGSFIALSEETSFGNSGGIVTRAPQWIPDLGQAKTGFRMMCAKQAGLRAAFAFPLIVHDEVIACVEFFAAEVRKPDTALMEATASIAGHLARVVERELSGKLQAQLAAIVENATVAIFTRTLDGTILTWNPGAEKLLGYTAGEAIGQSINFTLPPGRPPNLARNNENLLRGEVVARESDRITKDGRMIDVLTSHSPIRDGAGNIVGASVILQDITTLKQAQAAVKESEQRFRAIFDHAGVGITMRRAHDRHQPWVQVNDHFCRLLGYTREELLGLSTADITPADGQASAVKDNERLLRGEIASYVREKRVVRKDGREIWVMLAVAALPDAEGRPRDLIAVYQDITERVRAEAERSYLLNVLEASVNETYLFDAETLRFEYLNRSGLNNLGYSLEQMRDMTPLDLKREFTEASFREMLGPLLRGEKKMHVFHSAHRRADGSSYPVEAHLQLVERGDRRVFLAVILDITERKRAEEERTQYLNRLRALSRRLVETQETERRRLAAELHDRIGQNLTALTINLNIVSSQLSPQAAELHAPRLEDSRQLVEATIETVRNVISELRPTVLDDYGLLAALRWYVRQFEKRSGVLTTVEAPDLIPRLPTEAEAGLYRIAQEALNNTLKHANARCATLRLDADAACVTLTVADDGEGFDSAFTEPHARHPGWGLLMMRERAESVGGRLRVDSVPAHGTRVVVEINRPA